jgi:hypothetical protein
VPDAGAPEYTTICTAKVLKSGFSGDASLRAQCLADLQAAAGTPACLPDDSNLASACVRLFYEPSGPLPPGGHCTTAADCAGRANAITICEHLTTMPSACMTVAAGKLGDPCLGDLNASGWVIVAPYVGGSPTNVLYDGLYCPNGLGRVCLSASDPAKGYVCTALQPAGGPCQYPRGCTSGSCVTATGASPTPSMPGTCAMAPPAKNAPAGAPCSSSADCANGHCGNDHLCSPVSAVQELGQLAFCTSL